MPSSVFSTPGSHWQQHFCWEVAGAVACLVVQSVLLGAYRVKFATTPIPLGGCCAIKEGDPLPPSDRAPLAQRSLIDVLYRQNAPRLIRLFARRASQDEAGDLLQEAFARVTALKDPVATIAKPEAYLSTVAINLLRDRARAAARRAIEAQDFGASESVTDVDPHLVLENRDALVRLENAVKRLSPRRRQIFLLHRIEHMTYAEIAVKTGMSVKGVKTQMVKLLFELRRDIGSL